MEAIFDIDEKVLQRLHEVAKRRGTSVSALVEAGIFRILSEDNAMTKKRDALPPLPKLPLGPMLVDISNREELYRVMDEYDGFRY